MKIVFIIGTRPEFIKVAPVYKAFNEDPLWESILVSTGQHAKMLSQLYEFFEVYPDYDMKIMTDGQTLESLSAKMVSEISNLLNKYRPDFICVQGDTTTTFISSLAAYYQKIPVIHIEAGLRTLDKYSPFPEEVNRRLTSAIATFHFCPTSLSQSNLVKENITENSYIVGNTVIDSLLWADKKVQDNLEFYRKKFQSFHEDNRKLVLITAHRRESFDVGIKQITSAIRTLSTQHPTVNFIFPVHLNPQVNQIVRSELSDISNVSLLEPLAYDEMVYILKSSYLVLTDSGGIQEEAPAFNIPVIVMRETTERMEGVKSNASILAGTGTDSIIANFNNLIEDQSLYYKMQNSTNPFGSGNSSFLILETMNKVYNLA